MNRHDREELVDRPAVRQRLEQREVAKVAVDETRLEIGGNVFEFVAVSLGVARERVGRRDVDLLGNRALTKAAHAAIKEFLRAFFIEREIVKDFSDAALRDVLSRRIAIV